MVIFKILTRMFLMPGTLVLGMVNVSEEEDGGVFRSLVNMIFWGIVCVLITLPIVIKSI